MNLDLSALKAPKPSQKSKLFVDLCGYVYGRDMDWPCVVSRVKHLVDAVPQFNLVMVMDGQRISAAKMEEAEARAKRGADGYFTQLARAAVLRYLIERKIEVIIAPFEAVPVIVHNAFNLDNCYSMSQDSYTLC